MARVTTEQVYELLKGFPEGLTRFEVRDLYQDKKESESACSVLSRLEAMGAAKKDGVRVNPKTNISHTVYKPTGKSIVGSHSPAELAYRLGIKGLRGQVADLSAEIENLRKWKQAAIAKHPDLDVDPDLLAAREEVATIFAEAGLTTKAAMVASGEFDDSDAVQVALAMRKRRAA